MSAQQSLLDQTLIALVHLTRETALPEPLPPFLDACLHLLSELDVFLYATNDEEHLSEIRQFFVRHSDEKGISSSSSFVHIPNALPVPPPLTQETEACSIDTITAIAPFGRWSPTMSLVGAPGAVQLLIIARRSRLEVIPDDKVCCSVRLVDVGVASSSTTSNNNKVLESTLVMIPKFRSVTCAASLNDGRHAVVSCGGNEQPNDCPSWGRGVFLIDFTSGTIVTSIEAEFEMSTFWFQMLKPTDPRLAELRKRSAGAAQQKDVDEKEPSGENVVENAEYEKIMRDLALPYFLCDDRRDGAGSGGMCLRGLNPFGNFEAADEVTLRIIKTDDDDGTGEWGCCDDTLSGFALHPPLQSMMMNSSAPSARLIIRCHSYSYDNSSNIFHADGRSILYDARHGGPSEAFLHVCNGNGGKSMLLAESSDEMMSMTYSLALLDTPDAKEDSGGSPGARPAGHVKYIAHGMTALARWK